MFPNKRGTEIKGFESFPNINIDPYPSIDKKISYPHSRFSKNPKKKDTS